MAKEPGNRPLIRRVLLLSLVPFLHFSSAAGDEIAQRIELGGTIAGELVAPSSIDRYEIRVESPTMLVIESLDRAHVTGRLLSHRGDMDITGSRRTPFLRDDFQIHPYGFLIEACTRSGKYGLEVSGKSRFRAAGDYRLRVQEDSRYSYEGKVDSHSTRVSRAAAGADYFKMRTGEGSRTFQGELRNLGDAGYVEIEVLSPTVLVAEADSPSKDMIEMIVRLTGLDCTLDVRENPKDAPARRGEEGGIVTRTITPTVVRVPILLPGIYVLKVSTTDIWSDAPTAPYTLKLWEEGIDDHADEAAFASQVSLGSTLSGNWEHRGDIDFFRIDVDAPIMLRLETPALAKDPVTESNGWLSLHGPNGLRVRNPGPPFRIERRLSGPGHYYLELRNQSPVSGSYQLRVSGELTGQDDHADTGTDGTPVTLNSTIAGELETTGDVDLFRIEITSPTVLRVETLDDTTDVVGRVLGPRGWKPVKSLILGRFSGFVADEDGGYYDNHFRILRRISQPGIYFIKVKGYEGATGTYSFGVYAEGPDDHPDTRGQGTPIEPDSRIFSKLDWPGDVDRFQIAIDQPTTLVVEVDRSLPEDTRKMGPPITGRLVGPLDDKIAFLTGRTVHVIANTDDYGFRMEQRIARPGIYDLALSNKVSERIGSYQLQVSSE